MTETARQQHETVFAQAARLRPVTIDELASVRYLQIMAIRRLAVSHLAESELAAFCAYINSDPYSDRLADQVRTGRLLCATLMDEIVATAGWIPASDSGANARLMAVFVSPLYALQGLGKLVVGAAEAHAIKAGFRVFTIRAPIGSTAFFARLGYDVASHGVWTVQPDYPMPVGFMRKTVLVDKAVLVAGRSGGATETT